MTVSKILGWIKGEWADPSTHAWLVGLGATLAAWLNGALTDRQALIALVGAVLAIVIPTGSKP